MPRKQNPFSDEELEVIPLNDPDSFYTFDLGLSAALITTGFSLISIDREDFRKSQFVFRRALGLDETVSAYWADQLEVKARAYFDTQKMLKNRLYSE
jgi:hypothetical protein